MRKVDIPTKEMDKFAGKWVVIDPKKDRIIAVGSTLKELGSLVTRPKKDKNPAGTVPFSFLVPRKDEGPYILWMKSY